MEPINANKEPSFLRVLEKNSSFKIWKFISET